MRFAQQHQLFFSFEKPNKFIGNNNADESTRFPKQVKLLNFIHYLYVTNLNATVCKALVFIQKIFFVIFDSSVLKDCDWTIVLVI